MGSEPYNRDTSDYCARRPKTIPAMVDQGSRAGANRAARPGFGGGVANALGPKRAKRQKGPKGMTGR
jgi:hypothetical protein